MKRTGYFGNGYIYALKVDLEGELGYPGFSLFFLFPFSISVSLFSISVSLFSPALMTTNYYKSAPYPALPEAAAGHVVFGGFV